MTSLGISTRKTRSLSTPYLTMRGIFSNDHGFLGDAYSKVAQFFLEAGMRYYVAVLALALLSCTTNFVKPASVENTPVQRLSEEDREYLVESYRKSYLKVIREKSELDAFTFPLLKEAIEVASSISDDVVPKKFRKYTSGYSYGFSLIGNHLIMRIKSRKRVRSKPRSIAQRHERVSPHRIVPETPSRCSSFVQSN